MCYLQVEMRLFAFGQRRSAIRESQEIVQSEQVHLKELDLELRQAIPQTYDQIDTIDRTLAALQNDYAKICNNAALTRAQRHGGSVDELTLIGPESTSLSARESLESEELLKRLTYAELQNLSADPWRRAQ
jgi:outer membrane protein TolC